MYLIVTANEEIVKQAKSNGDAVFESCEINVNTSDTQTKVGLTNKKSEIDELLYSYGMAPHLKGYDCLKYILEKCTEDKNYLKKGYTVHIYPECAKQLNDTAQNVERAIRYAIQNSYEQHHLDWLYLDKSTKPTASELIAIMSKELS